MEPEPQRRKAAQHEYELFQERRPAGRLEWRTASRQEAGWYLVLPGREPEKLEVDVALGELAADVRSPSGDWELNAELAALLSTPMALDAAERRLHGRPERSTGRFRRVDAPTRFEIYVTGLDAVTLAHAVPQLPVESVADISVLSGMLLPEAFEIIARRIALLGGRIVAVFRDGEQA